MWLFLGLSFLKLGIGFAIATIVRNLRVTGQRVLNAYRSAGVAGVEASRLGEPWYGRLFTRFLFSGILVVGFFFLLTLWWDANLVFLSPNPPMDRDGRREDSGRGEGVTGAMIRARIWVASGGWRAVCRRFWGHRWRPTVAVASEMAG